MIISLNRKKTKITALAVLTLFVVIAIAIISATGTKKSTDKPDLFNTNAEFVNGIDVSQHNGAIEWDKVANDTDFAIIRTGYRGYGNGNIIKDSLFEENIIAANKENIPVGVYFYSQAISEQEACEEAEFVLDLIKHHNIDLPVFIDYEYAYNNDGELAGRLFNSHLSSAQAADIINAFCERINKAGKYAGVYSSSSIYNFDIKTSALNKNIYIWVADYNNKLSFIGSYDVWQYSKHGSCNGVNSKYVDTNRWYTNNS